MRVIKPEPEDEHIVQRLATAVICEWGRLPEHVRDNPLRAACLANNPDPSKVTISLREQIEVFIREHQEDA